MSWVAEVAGLTRSVVAVLSELPGSEVEASIGPPASEKDVRRVEESIRRVVPSNLRQFLLEFSASVEVRWHWDSADTALPPELEELGAGGEFDLVLGDCRSHWEGWEAWRDSLEHPEDYDSAPPAAGFGSTFPLLSSFFGDEIVLVSGAPPKDGVYYLNHEGETMHWARLGRSLEEFLRTWIGLGCPGPGYGFLLPFYDEGAERLSLDLPLSQAYRRALGLLSD